MKYTITFIAKLSDGTSMQKTYRIKNCMNELHAKIRANEFCERKLVPLNLKIVDFIVTDCYQDPFEMLGIDFNGFL